MPAFSNRSSCATVYAHLRASILSGAMPAGTRLPPSRRLANELGIARQTVVLAYERLGAEGYIRSRTGSGTFVAEELPDLTPGPGAPARTAAIALSRRGKALASLPSQAVPGSAPLLLAPGIPAPELFPVRAWAACTARVLRRADAVDTRYPDPQGQAALRVQVAAHLAATRGLAVDPDCILITAGTQQALRMAAEILLDPGDLAWVEDPGYISGRGALRAAGAEIVGIPGDSDGLDVAAGERLAPGARLALVAPSHATPLGGAMAVFRRLALLDWAGRAGACVLEDDCDTEFRWQGKPLPPLATLDTAGHVIYCGTFSKTLAPALRLGFAVMPPPLVAPAIRARALMDRGTSLLMQTVLTEFMRDGLLAPHVRRMRIEYAKRRDALLDALARHAPALRPVAAPGGLHLTIFLPDGTDEAASVRTARLDGLGVAPLSAYAVSAETRPGLVVGFASTPAALSADAARRLWRAVTRPRAVPLLPPTRMPAS